MGWSCDDDVAAVVEGQARNIHGDGYEFFWVLLTLRLIPLSYFLLLLSNNN